MTAFGTTSPFKPGRMNGRFSTFLVNNVHNCNVRFRASIAQSETATCPSGDHGKSVGAGTSSPMTSSEMMDIKTKLENAGYTQVRDIKSTAEGFSAKAMKQGNEVSLTTRPPPRRSTQWRRALALLRHGPSPHGH